MAFLPSCEIWSDCNTGNHTPSCGLVFALFFQPPDIAFRSVFVCIGSVGHAPKQKSVYTQKNAKITCYLVTNG